MSAASLIGGGRFRDRLRAVYVLCAALPAGAPAALRVAAEVAPEEVARAFRNALAEATVEGTSIDAALERSLSTVDWAPLREAVTALIRGGNTEVSLDILRRYVESEIEAESREISLRLGIRTTAAFSAITVVAASVVTGSAPPSLIAPAAAAISLSLLAASVRRWIRPWRARA